MKTLLGNRKFRAHSRLSASKMNAIQDFVKQQRKGIDIISESADVESNVDSDGQRLNIDVYPKLWRTTAAPSGGTVTAKQAVGSSARVEGPERTFDVPVDASDESSSSGP